MTRNMFRKISVVQGYQIQQKQKYKVSCILSGTPSMVLTYPVQIEEEVNGQETTEITVGEKAL